jgi:hypothetical protein
VIAALELAEAAACADLMRAAPAAWGCVAEHTPNGWCLFAPRLDQLLFNRLIGLGAEGPVSCALLREALERYRASGIRNFGAQLSPVPEATGIAMMLEHEGLVPRDNWTKVSRTANALPPAAPVPRVSAIDTRDAERHASIVCAAFAMPSMLEPWLASIVGRPGWHHYLAWEDDEPIGTAALYVQGDVGWLGIAGTLPAARRRGAQGALMVHRLREGARLGCRTFVTETGEDRPDRPNPSFHNMRRTGFEVGYQRPNYMPVKQG